MDNRFSLFSTTGPRARTFFAVAFSAITFFGNSAARSQVSLEPAGVFRQQEEARRGAEICAYEAGSRRLFVTNNGANCLDVLDLSEPANLRLLKSIDLTSLGSGPTSVSARQGLVAAAIVAHDPQEPGRVAFLAPSGVLLKTVTVGAMPDMVCFTPDGKTLLVANEGEPSDDYTRDPEGSVSMIDLTPGARRLTQANVTTLDFQRFNSRARQLDPSIRIFGPGATVAQDLEPEYIAVAPDSKTAWVTLQENNALAIIDLDAKKVVKLVGLGFKDHGAPSNGLDASDRDGKVNIRPWPVRGMFQPDGIAAFQASGKTYLVTANEGDPRVYAGYREVTPVRSLRLDPQIFPNAGQLQHDGQLGRLRVTSAAKNGNPRRAICSFGTRSFSIWSSDGKLVHDSGDFLERKLAEILPAHFNSDGSANRSFDSRSIERGPEPENVVVGTVGERLCVFLALERIGGIMVFDITNPRRPVWQSYATTRNFHGSAEAGTAGDLAPEGLLFIPTPQSPVSEPLLVACFEGSGTTRVFRILRKPRSS